MSTSNRPVSILCKSAFTAYGTYEKPQAARTDLATQRELAAQKGMPAESQYFPTQFNETKAMIEPYWRLFNAIMENQPKNDIVLHRGILQGVGIPLIGMRLASDPHPGLPSAGGIDHFPREIQAQLRVGAAKHNHCDYSIQLFLIYLEPLLQKVGATVEWLTVGPKPKLLFHSMPQAAQLWIRHSVFRITTALGEKLIADFTIEQFGYPSSWWFMEEKAYLAQCTNGEKIKQPSVEEVRCARDGKISGVTTRDGIAIEICESEYLDDWMTQDEREREVGAYG